MKKVRFIFPYDFPIHRQFRNEKELIWNNYQFYFKNDQKTYDFVIVFNGVQQVEKVNCSKGGLIFITGESKSIKQYNQKFLNQFDHIVTCQEQINHNHKILTHHGYPWHVEQNYTHLKAIQSVEKTDDIILISSNKGFNKGHIDRLKFSYKCKAEFKDAIDFYGRGIKSFSNKWNLISKYYFSLAIENDSVKNYFTEKLVDSFLSLSLPIYHGCPNLDDFFPKESYLPININNFKESKEVINYVLNNKEKIYKQRFDALLEAKRRVLEEHQLFPMIEKILNSLQYTNQSEAITIQEYPDSKLTILNRRLRRYYYSKKAIQLTNKLVEIL